MSVSNRAELRLPHDSGTLPLVRELARMFVGSRLERERLEDLQILLTEAVANAVVHGSPLDNGQIVVTIELDGSVVRCVVRTGATDARSRHAAGEPDAPDLGLRLVDTLADHWGMAPDGEGALWFEIDGAVPTWHRRTAEYVIDCRALACVN